MPRHCELKFYEEGNPILSWIKSLAFAIESTSPEADFYKGKDQIQLGREFLKTYGARFFRMSQPPPQKTAPPAAS